MKTPPQIEDRLLELQDALVQELLARIRSGKAKPADLAVARAILRDNKIEALPQPGSALADLATVLPFPTRADTPPPMRKAT